MPYPREFLASTQFANVRTIRASGDYHAGKDQWKIGPTSLLAHAVGLAPFKDTFYTSTDAEAGGADGGVEVNAELETVVATLSMGMVGPGDGLGLTNRTRLMRCCNEDGLVLRGLRPAVPIDAWWAGAVQGELWYTHTLARRGGDAAGLRVYYVLAAGLQAAFELRPSDLGESGASYHAFSWRTRNVHAFNESHPLALAAAGAEDAVGWDLWAISEGWAPAGWAPVGDPDKYAGAAPERIQRFDDDRIYALGQPGESITACAISMRSSALRCGTAVANATGTAAVAISHA